MIEELNYPWNPYQNQEKFEIDVYYAYKKINQIINRIGYLEKQLLPEVNSEIKMISVKEFQQKLVHRANNLNRLANTFLVKDDVLKQELKYIAAKLLEDADSLNHALFNHE